MNDRLKQFLTMEGLSPAQFAEIMGIQRSGISHLLLGRNNPSYEFIQKMMTAFPKVNYEWLILGKGKPYKDNDEPATPSAESTLFPDEENFTPKYQQSEVAENPKFEVAVATDTQIRDRKIERITIYYSDGTYEDR